MLKKKYFLSFIFLHFLVSFLISCLYANASKSNIYLDGTHQLIKRAQSVIYVDDRSMNFAPALIEPKVGDNRLFYVVDFSRSNKAYFVSATCRSIGEFCYIYVEDSQWQKGKVTNIGISEILNAFDKSTPADNSRGIYKIETESFGPIQNDIDLDPKVYILILDIPDNNDNGSFIAGYFDPLNQKKGLQKDINNGQQFRSNESEILYIDCDPLDIRSISAKETLAHEFQHLLHWQNDSDEDEWINEGCANYASLFLCGYGLRRKSSHVEAFERNPQVSLVYWNRKKGDELANYGAAYLWMLYLHENYGGVKTISNIISDSENGINSINKVISARGYSKNFYDIFSEWKIANYLDSLDYDSGIFGYKNLDLNLMDTIRHNQLPVSKISRNIRSYCADYIVFSKDQKANGLNIDFIMQGDASDFDMRIISLKNNKIIDIDNAVIVSGTAKIIMPLFGYEVDRVIVMPSWLPRNRAYYGSAYSYNYTANSNTGLAFKVVVLQNAVNKKYIEILAKLAKDEIIETAMKEQPYISIRRNGKAVIEKQKMRQINNIGMSKAYFSYQFMVPDNINYDEISWELYYLGQLNANGSLKSLDKK